MRARKITLAASKPRIDSDLMTGVVKPKLPSCLR